MLLLFLLLIYQKFTFGLEQFDILGCYALNNSLNYPNKVEGWNTSCEFACDWDGIVCDKSNQHVINITLINKALYGYIPTEIGLFTSLIQLNLEINFLTGTIPTQIGKINSLQLLSFYQNLITGTIPQQITNLEKLTYLVIGRIELSGTIPSQIGNLELLSSIYIHNTLISGIIPSSIGKLKKLLCLELSSNHLTGPIPTSIGLLNRLYYLDLTYNSLNGPIPTQIGNLCDAKILNMGNNEHLSGTIPSQIGNIINLTFLSLCTTQISGVIPSSITKIKHLKTLYLYSTQLYGCPTLPPYIIEYCIIDSIHPCNCTLTSGCSFNSRDCFSYLPDIQPSLNKINTTIINDNYNNTNKLQKIDWSIAFQVYTPSDNNITFTTSIYTNKSISHDNMDVTIDGDFTILKNGVISFHGLNISGNFTNYGGIVINNNSGIDVNGCALLSGNITLNYTQLGQIIVYSRSGCIIGEYDKVTLNGIDNCSEPVLEYSSYTVTFTDIKKCVQSGLTTQFIAIIATSATFLLAIIVVIFVLRLKKFRLVVFPFRDKWKEIQKMRNIEIDQSPMINKNK